MYGFAIACGNCFRNSTIRKEWEESRFEQICGELRELIADVDRHNEREIELLQESTLVDEGGEG